MILLAILSTILLVCLLIFTILNAISFSKSDIDISTNVLVMLVVFIFIIPLVFSIITIWLLFVYGGCL